MMAVFLVISLVRELDIDPLTGNIFLKGIFNLKNQEIDKRTEDGTEATHNSN